MGIEPVQRRVCVPVRKFIRGRRIDWGIERVRCGECVPVRKFIRGRRQL